MEILAVAGFMMAGYTLPEVCVLLGSGKHFAPPMMNVFTTISAGLLSTYFLFN